MSTQGKRVYLCGRKVTLANRLLKVIGFSLAGTMHSPESASLVALYPGEALDANNQHRQTTRSAMLLSEKPKNTPLSQETTFQGQQLPSSSTQNFDSSGISDAGLLLNLHSPYDTSPHLMSPENTSSQPIFDGAQSSLIGGQHQLYQGTQDGDIFAMPYGNLMIESQDLDMAAVMNDDMVWWGEYLPNNLMGAFDPGGPNDGH
jgi:hypothetical protein